jgi:hypothetical protein
MEALSIRMIGTRGARGLSPKANNFTGLVTYIVYDGLRWRLHHILHLSTPNVLISSRTGMGYPAKFYPCSEPTSDNRKAKI